MRRWVLPILFLLAGGVVISVLVAWVLAIAVSMHADYWTSPTFQSASELTWCEYWLVERWNRGSAIMVTSYRCNQLYGFTFGTDDDPEELVPAWTGLSAPAAEFQSGNMGVSETRIVQGRGWPLCAMWYECRYDQSRTVAEIRGGIPVNLPAFRGPAWIDFVNPRALPLRVIWLPFLFDTFFFAFVLWLLIGSALALRRFIRARRGLCPRCTYDLRGALADGCPECGWKRREA